MKNQGQCCAHLKIEEKITNHEDGTCSSAHLCLSCGARFITTGVLKGAVKLLEDFKEMMDLSDHQHFTNKQFDKWEKLNDRFDSFKEMVL